MPPTDILRGLALARLCLPLLPLAGCSVMAPAPVWELAKAGAGLASMAIAAAPSRASQTHRQFNGALDAVCIRFDPDTPVADIVPALQAELRRHRVESRVYDRAMPAETCATWLQYAAQIDWDQPPFHGEFKPFLRHAALSLRSARGEVLSTSQYLLDGGFSQGKWTSTREKLAPVVTALLTGIDGSEPAFRPETATSQRP